MPVEAKKNDPVDPAIDPCIETWCRAASRYCSLLVIAVGAIVIVGWSANIAPLKSVLPGFISMKPNTALGFLFCGVGLFSLTGRPTKLIQHFGRPCAIAAILLGVLTMAEYLTGRNFGIDEALFRDLATNQDFYPGRMAPGTAISFGLFGTALLALLMNRSLQLARILSVLVGILSFVATLGYLYGVKALYTFPVSYASLAIHTALSFIALCLGLLLAQPREGMLSIITSNTTGGYMARRLLPAALLLPVLVGWLRLRGQQAGLYGLEFGLSLYVMSNVLIFSALVLWNATRIFHADRKHAQLEERLRQAQKMEAVGQLAGGVAHDFNNLLTVINGRSQLMMSRFKPGEKMRNDLELVYKTGERAAALTRQLLAFSRQQVLEPVVLDLNAVAADMDKMLRRLIREDIDLVAILDRDLKRVRADPGQIEQVIMNLVVNARDAMPDGGKLTIETANVELSDEYCRSRADVKPGKYVMLAVSDTGHGMDATVKARIFEPFFTTKPQGQGTGLGLAMVFGVVKQSNGHIEVYSEGNKGSTFKIYLPQTQDEPAVAASESQLVAPPGQEVILIVEDEEGVRELVRDLLEINGYTILMAQNGKEAMSVCRAHKGTINLVVTDVVMPEMGGPELVGLLKAAHPKTKVLFTSGYTDHAIVRNGTLEASVAFIQKPFTASNFVRKVRDVLDKT